MFHCVFYYFHHCKSIKKIFILAKTWTCSEETKAFKPQLQWCHQDPPKRWVKRCVCVGERGRGRDTNWAKSTCRNLIIPSHTVCRGRRLGWAHRWMCFYSKVHKVLLTTLLTVVVVVCRRTTTMQWQMKLTQRQRWEPGVVSPQIFCFNVKTYYYFFFYCFWWLICLSSSEDWCDGSYPTCQSLQVNITGIHTLVRVFSVFYKQITKYTVDIAVFLTFHSPWFRERTQLAALLLLQSHWNREQRAPRWQEVKHDVSTSFIPFVFWFD